MPDLHEASIIPFGRNKMIVSPKLLRGEPSNAGSRESMLNRMHDMFEVRMPVISQRIGILLQNLEGEIVKNPDVWGGDGICFEIPFLKSACDLSKALGNEVVVYDVRQKRHFVDGVECFVEKSHIINDLFNVSVP